MIAFAYRNKAGQACIYYPNLKDRQPGEPQEEWLQRNLARGIPPDAEDLHQVDPRTLPGRTFRDAWCIENGAVGISMERARDVRRAQLREARRPLLTRLDIDYQRADEAGDAERKKAIAQEKQWLRDITAHPDIDAAQTIEDLARVRLDLPYRHKR